MEGSYVYKLPLIPCLSLLKQNTDFFLHIISFVDFFENLRVHVAPFRWSLDCQKPSKANTNPFFSSLVNDFECFSSMVKNALKLNKRKIIRCGKIYTY